MPFVAVGALKISTRAPSIVRIILFGSRDVDQNPSIIMLEESRVNRTFKIWTKNPLLLYGSIHLRVFGLWNNTLLRDCAAQIVWKIQAVIRSQDI